MYIIKLRPTRVKQLEAAMFINAVMTECVVDYFKYDKYEIYMEVKTLPDSLGIYLDKWFPTQESFNKSSLIMDENGYDVINKKIREDYWNILNIREKNRR